MLLADVGNSRIKWVSCEQGEFRQRGQSRHDQESWPELIARLWREAPRPQRVLIVNVAGPQVRAALTDWIQQAWAIDAEFAVCSTAAFGVRNAYAEPERMGADRWVAMIAARALASVSASLAARYQRRRHSVIANVKAMNATSVPSVIAANVQSKRTTRIEQTIVTSSRVGRIV